MKIIEKFKQYSEEQAMTNYSEENGFVLENIDKVNSYRDDTLFCIAGMQKYYDVFTEKKKPDDTQPNVICNNQAVLRMNDENEIGDGTHFLYFNMLGYFDFSADKTSWTRAFRFWLSFVLDNVDGKFTVDKNSNFEIHAHSYIKNVYFSSYHDDFVINKWDDALIWQEGDLIGYSTEFYIDGVEVGNIVLYENGMIDCGFGAERLEMFYNKDYKKPSEIDILIQTCEVLIKSGFKPSNVKQGYVLRKLLTKIVKHGINIFDNQKYRGMYTDRNGCYCDHNDVDNINDMYNMPSYILLEDLCEKYNLELFEEGNIANFLQDECDRLIKNIKKYERLKDKHKDKSKEWWWDTHGVDLNCL